jgi:hypothetical protein
MAWKFFTSTGAQKTAPLASAFPTIQRGVSGSFSCGANGSLGTTTVTFPVAFASTPRVAIALNWLSDPGNVIQGHWVDNITTTTFQIHARQNSAGGVSATANWIAIDP